MEGERAEAPHYPADMACLSPQGSVSKKRKSTDSEEAEGEGGEAMAVSGVEEEKEDILTASIKKAQAEAERELAAAREQAAKEDDPPAQEPVVPILLRGDLQVRV